MLEGTLNLEKIESTVLKVCDAVEKYKNAQLHWSTLSEQCLWRELVSCILGSRVRYETAKACTEHLDNIGLLDIKDILTNPLAIEKQIFRELNQPIYPPFTQRVGSKYRYPKSKAGFIVSTGHQLYATKHGSIREILQKSINGIEARETLVKNCKGIGPKQASLFLRNIGFSEDLAILDCHVNRYIDLIQLDERYRDFIIKKNNQYFKNENMLRIYAISKKKSLATMDMGIWIVMRLIKKEKLI